MRHTELLCYQPSAVLPHSSNASEESTGDHDDIMCSICRQILQPLEICRKLIQCQHIFHQSCADAWFVRHRSCPMCRREFPSF
ncbi:MAG: hypothetical protein EBX37_12290, partial [Alphaproteobacteria bacterium]|nr:hypothetical protein [Alphaproteobacteria bacterium]